ncbi:MAG: hypothetical protein AAGG57_09190 [Pseudomonadota bacterium]
MLAAQDTQLEFALGQSLRTGHRTLLNAAMPKAGVHQLAHVLFELASGTQLLLNWVIRERLVDVSVFHGAQLHLPTAAQELVPQGHFDIGNRQYFLRNDYNAGPAQLDFFSHQRLSLGQLEFLGIVSASAIDLVPSDFIRASLKPKRGYWPVGKRCYQPFSSRPVLRLHPPCPITR